MITTMMKIIILRQVKAFLLAPLALASACCHDHHQDDIDQQDHDDLDDNNGNHDEHDDNNYDEDDQYKTHQGIHTRPPCWPVLSWAS